MASPTRECQWCGNLTPAETWCSTRCRDHNRLALELDLYTAQPTFDQSPLPPKPPGRSPIIDMGAKLGWPRSLLACGAD